MEKICVGKIVNTFGLKGDLKVLLNQEVNLKNFFIGNTNSSFECEKQIDNKKFVKIKLKGYDDINQVTQFVGKNIYVDSVKDEKLAENEYYISDLIGSKLFDGEKLIGEITDVENFGATDIFVFEDNGKEMRVPFVLDFFESIDTEQKVIKVTKKFYEGVAWSSTY